ncbi:MAG: hypothetical protein QNJ97_24590 [Myxococcota bacterium]|nr:hypothetical protein [Myxococcota bacterium]
MPSNVLAWPSNVIEVINTGFLAQDIVFIGGSEMASFIYTPINCDWRSKLQPGQSCSYSVKFIKDSGTATSVVAFVATASNTTYTITVIGQTQLPK